MPATTFQFRVCQNPECRLRYPVEVESGLGERCPICLGTTLVAAEQGAQPEMESRRASTPAHELHGLLDNVRSAWNVGSIFRSAEGFGFKHIYLGGITPTPEDPQVRKTALGAEDIVGWSTHRNAVELASSLRGHGWAIWALEKTANSCPIDTAIRERKAAVSLVLVVGNERAGIDPGILDLADQVVHIEMRGRKQSFNVAVAFAVAAHTMRLSLDTIIPE